MISVVIDCNIIFFLMFIVLIILSMHAFIGYSFLVKICKWAMYFTQKADCNFKQTIVNIDYARGWEECLKSFLKTIHSTIIKILPYSWLIIL